MDLYLIKVGTGGIPHNGLYANPPTSITVLFDWGGLIGEFHRVGAEPSIKKLRSAVRELAKALRERVPKESKSEKDIWRGLDATSVGKLLQIGTICLGKQKGGVWFLVDMERSWVRGYPELRRVRTTIDRDRIIGEIFGDETFRNCRI